VLVVEDEVTDQLLLSGTIEARGHTPVVCPDGESAWEALREGDFPIIVLDLALPGMQGIELCRRIREGPRGASPVILVVTGVREPDLLTRVLEAGADDYLTKPIDSALLQIRLAVAERDVRARWEGILGREQIAARNQELSSLYRITEMILRAGDEEAAYGPLLEAVAESTGFPLVLVETLDDKGEFLTVTAARGLGMSPSVIPPALVEQTLSGVAIATGRPVLETDARRRREHARDALQRLRLRTYLAFPMFSSDRVVGTLTLAHTEAVVPDRSLVEWAGSLANSLASFVERTGTQAALKESESRYRTLATQLQRANDELESFAYSVSHDLRAPLRTMQGFAYALIQDFGGVLPDEARDYADRIIRSGRQSELLISDLLAYSRLSYEDVVLSPVPLGEVVADAREHLGADLAAARIVVDEPLPTVRGQRATLVTVVSNLLSNAVKFVPPDRTPEIRIRADKATGRTRLWIEDNGVGIPEKQRERVFRVFERLVDEGVSRPGTGIGLAIVRRGMERLGGRVGVEGRQPHGSAFWLELLSAG
jgi:signal transduction histidine kinase